MDEQTQRGDDVVTADQIELMREDPIPKKSKGRLKVRLWFNGLGAAHVHTPSSGLVIAARVDDKPTGPIDTERPAEILIYDDQLEKMRRDLVETEMGAFREAQRTAIGLLKVKVVESGDGPSGGVDAIPDDIEKWLPEWKAIVRLEPISAEGEFFRTRRRGLKPLRDIEVVDQAPLPKTREQETHELAARNTERSMDRVGQALQSLASSQAKMADAIAALVAGGGGSAEGAISSADADALRAENDRLSKLLAQATKKKKSKDE